jgi:hypothetical protein
VRLAFGRRRHYDVPMRMRAVLLLGVGLGLGLASGCSSEAEIFDAPKKTDVGTSPQYNKCSFLQPCDPGFECVDELCTPEVTAPEDAGMVDTGELDAGVADVPEPMDMVEPTDPGMIPDPGPMPTDPGTIPDPGPDLTPVDTGPPPDDLCPIPGEAGGCDDFTAPCRLVEDQGGALMCVESTVFKTFGAPCVSHSDCDVLYGCHFGVCTVYCELLFGANKCLNASPDGENWSCNDLKHPQWGACGP